MKPKTLVVLTVVALALTLATILTRKTPNRNAGTLGGKVLPALDINAVRSLRVIAPEGTVTVSRVDGTWVCEEAHGYPVDFERLKKALIELSNLKVGQVMRLDDEQKAAIKLIPTSGETPGVGVELFDQAGKTLASLVLGKERRRDASPSPYGAPADGRYITVDEGKTALLVSSGLAELAAAQPQNWLKTDILNVPASDVMRVSIAGPGRTTVVLTRTNATAELDLEGVGPSEAFDTSKRYGLSAGLSYLRFDDIADPALDETVAGLDDPVLYEATTGKGATYTLALGASPADRDGRYAVVRVTLAPADMDASLSEEDAAKAAKERATLEDEVAALNARLGKWTFVIGKHKADPLMAGRNELVKSIEKEDPVEEEKTSETSGT